MHLVLLMSALGQKQTCAAQKVMSGLPPKADMLVLLEMSALGQKQTLRQWTSASFDRLLADAACVRDQAVQARGAVPH